MPKLAIYVPKKDMKELEKWRKTINFSQVFMKALMDEIHQRSRTPVAGDDQLTAAAQHYRRELAGSASPMVDLGFQLGSRQVMECQLDSATIRTLLDLGSCDLLSAQDQATVENAIGDQLEQLTQRACDQGYDDQSHPGWRWAAAKGYLQGISTAWDQICETMKLLE